LPQNTKALQVKLKKLVEHAVIPKKATIGSAGFDLVATDCSHNRNYNFIEFGTGIAIQIPKGYMGLVYPRSSISKTPHSLCNSVGVIDSDYTGEIILRFRTSEDKQYEEYMVGDRIGQLIIVESPNIEFEEVDKLLKTGRSEGSFGSTGK